MVYLQVRHELNGHRSALRWLQHYQVAFALDFVPNLADTRSAATSHALRQSRLCGARKGTALQLTTQHAMGLLSLLGASIILGSALCVALVKSRPAALAVSQAEHDDPLLDSTVLEMEDTPPPTASRPSTERLVASAEAPARQ